MHARHGTTSLLATTMTATRAELEVALTDVGRAMRDPQPARARILGVHLEGPFINPGRLGAQRENAPRRPGQAAWRACRPAHQGCR